MQETNFANPRNVILYKDSKYFNKGVEKIFSGKCRAYVFLSYFCIMKTFYKIKKSISIEPNTVDAIEFCVKQSKKQKKVKPLNFSTAIDFLISKSTK